VVNDFAGKTALITGAGRGIGRAVALGLADTETVQATPDITHNRRWGGRGSNPRPADYEKHARLQHAPGQQRCLASMP
jgi:NAD(P)-dependent dehydrogenase (short-subunit alcohol dehydrogenase family)